MRFKKLRTSVDANQSLPTNRVFAYRSYRSGSQRNTGRRQSLPERRSQETESHKTGIRKLLSIVMFMLIAGGLFSTLLLSDNPKVNIILTDGGVQRRDETAYHSGVADIWRDDINNLTKLTADTQKISRQLEEAFPEIASAAIELPLLGRQPVVLIRTQPAIATLSNQSGTYYLAESGKLIGEVTADFTYAGTATLLSITDNSGLLAKTGEYALNTDQVYAILAIVSGLEQSNMDIDEVILPPAANQIDIRVAGELYYIKFSMLEKPSQAVGALLAAADIFESSGKPAEYVDVRIPEKVYYK